AGEERESDAYFVAGGENGKLDSNAKVQRFAVGALERIREVAENQGGSIPLTRSLQGLWDQQSSQSDLVILMTPNFLFADGREMLRSSAPEFQAIAKRWLIPDVGAVTLSATAGESDLYLELRQAASGGATPTTLLRTFRESIAKWPDWAEDFILRSVPDPSWRLLANRLPMMLRFVGEHTRSTIMEDAVVASTYLPTDAAAQVALGSLLAMNTAPGELVAQETTTKKALTVEEMLNRPMSISFTQESLQFAVDAVSDEFSQSLPAGSTMPKVRIIGGDLELSGITQNQQIRGFEKSDVPLRTVLTELVLGANPDRTATGPKDSKQSLVWVVHPAGKPPAETEILITTRAASAGKYELPAEFGE
ncbi:MAG: serine/threonine protein kinase, partial [Planctomycetota bacterium]